MKKIGSVVVIVLLVAAVAVPVMAWGPGRGWFGGNGGGPGSCWRNGGGYGAELSPDQKVKLDSLEQKFENDTNALRNSIWSKTRELDAFLGSENPDPAKASALQNELSALRAEMEQKRLSSRLSSKEIAPNQGRFFGGSGRGPAGNRPCWN